MKVNEETVVKIIEHHFGKKPKAVKELTGGLANFVFEVHVEHEKLIVRISDEQTKLQYFMKEQWAVQKAKEMKVPTAEILEVGNEGSKFPYMITRKVEGVPGHEYPDRLSVLKEMGKYTALINTIPTSGYGHVFEWSGNTLSWRETWKEFLEKELEAWKQIETFEKHKVLHETNLKKLKKQLKELEGLNHKPTLNHGDMRLKNVLLDEKGKIKAILDWENCKSLIAPHWDISIALHDLNNDEKEMFLEGYGMKEKDYLKLLPAIKVINILNYGPFVLMAHEQKNKVWMDRIKLRLNGDFDLYSL